ncbi:flagellar assembly peptidoglycan hydrolase FlgJ [Glaciimonas soli]|uniref:Peptidoglycan hydrolase FlgJ n=1 Tax=Glaciimonas soli TaxID=2590999 RepID=A0A843YPR7_9BURK|nr:flagellar assembly peptidoglycan hydrolase FlgJ [Glaciimonas soli]MQQ99457.1 flagellar assembly peptidoglycan hydrolase FlgJ [Glaciimonas soli]
MGINGSSIQSTARSGADLDQRFALDVQGVNALRRTVKNSPEAGVKQVSRQFEAMFMQMVLKSMREAMPTEGGMFDTQTTKQFTSMLDQQLAQNLSGRGLGLTEMMQAQLTQDTRKREQAQADIQDVLKDREPARGLPLDGSQMQNRKLNLKPQQSVKQLSEAALKSEATVSNLSFYDIASGQGNRANGTPAHVQQFVDRMADAAEKASAVTGVSAQLILAQAALESGWGKREIKNADGSSSHNVFGIKAHKGWQGNVVTADTSEYVNDVKISVNDKFRSYGSYEEAFTDYANFLKTNPRYAKVLASNNPAEAAHGLQRAGYATDPQYGNKLVSIMRKIA